MIPFIVSLFVVAYGNLLDVSPIFLRRYGIFGIAFYISDHFLYTINPAFAGDDVPSSPGLSVSTTHFFSISPFPPLFLRTLFYSIKQENYHFPRSFKFSSKIIFFLFAITILGIILLSRSSKKRERDN